jgi:single-strand DNA-binding protein
MYQQITLVGNLGNDPELRLTPSGVSVANFSLAVNRTWTGQDGQRQDKTLWFRVTAWRKHAETVGQYLTKGQRVLVIGEIEEARAYTDREGNLRAALEVTAQTIKFLSAKGETGEPTGPASATEAVKGISGDEADIPF